MVKWNRKGTPGLWHQEQNAGKEREEGEREKGRQTDRQNLKQMRGRQMTVHKLTKTGIPRIQTTEEQGTPQPMRALSSRACSQHEY